MNKQETGICFLAAVFLLSAAVGLRNISGAYLAKARCLPLPPGLLEPADTAGIVGTATLPAMSRQANYLFASGRPGYLQNGPHVAMQPDLPSRFLCGHNVADTSGLGGFAERRV